MGYIRTHRLPSKFNDRYIGGTRICNACLLNEDEFRYRFAACVEILVDDHEDTDDDDDNSIM